jgi:hypothetical protein
MLDDIKDLGRRGVPSTITRYAIRDGKGEEWEAVILVKSPRCGHRTMMGLEGSQEHTGQGG